MTHLCSAAVEHGPASRRFLDLCIYFANHVLYPNLVQTLMTWAGQFHATSFRIGHTAGVRLRSLDHGAYALRNYHERYESWRGEGSLTAPHPAMDFNVGATGLLEWISEPRFDWVSLIHAYFGTRDGEVVQP